MRVALYTGDHRGDGLRARLGRWAIRLAQKGRFRDVTHVEAILDELEDGRVTIASASLMDGGVRFKTCRLQPGNWIVVDVFAWSTAEAILWFSAHDGQPYDVRGAIATVLPGHRVSGEWFCNEAVGASAGLLEPHTFTPSQFAAIALSIGRDITDAFFAERKAP